MKLHHQVVESPAPRQPLSPSQALHLASEGPRGRWRQPAAATSQPTEPGETIDIVLTDVEAEHGDG